MSDLCEVVITAPDPEWLIELTRRLVDDGLCSNGHNYTPIRSVYRWHGKTHDRTEGRVSLHTRKSLLPEIIRRVRAEHPYEVPSISTRPIEDGDSEYLDWIRQSTHDAEHRQHTEPDPR